MEKIQFVCLIATLIWGRGIKGDEETLTYNVDDHFELDSITSGLYSLEIVSYTPGHILWETDDVPFPIIDVNIQTDNEEDLRRIKTNLVHNEEDRKLTLITEYIIPEEGDSPSTATDIRVSFCCLITLLSLWLLLSRGPIAAVFLPFSLLCGMLCYAESTSHITKNILITTPRNFTFTSVTLRSEHGPIEVPSDNNLDNVECYVGVYKNGMQPECAECCHGHGSCVTSESGPLCQCVEGFSESTNCQVEEAPEVEPLTVSVTVENYWTDDSAEFHWSGVFSHQKEATIGQLLANSSIGSSLNEHEEPLLLADVSSDDNVWLVFKSSDQGRCILSAGMDYIPVMYDQVILSYTTHDDFYRYPRCNDHSLPVYTETSKMVTAPEDPVQIRLEVSQGTESWTTCVSGSSESSLYDLMVHLQQHQNHLFGFESTDYGGDLGHFITSIGGVSQASDNSNYWAIFSRTPSGDKCLLNTGVSSYMPQNGEHIIFQLSPSNTYELYPSCGEEIYTDIENICADFNMERPAALVPIRISIENHMTDDVKEYSLTLCTRFTENITMFDIMNTTAAHTSNFRFEYTEFDGLGAFINEINDLAGSTEDQTYWTLLRHRGEQGECSLQTGVSSLRPGPGEHIVFSYQTYDSASVYPACEDPPEPTTEQHDCVPYTKPMHGDESNILQGPVGSNNLRLTLENLVTDDVREFQLTLCVSGPPLATLYDILNYTATNLPALSFESIDYGGELGHFISSVNGVGSNAAANTYWAIVRRRPGHNDCFYSVGASTYQPVTGEHVVLKYFNWGDGHSEHDRDSCEEITPDMSLHAEDDECFP